MLKEFIWRSIREDTKMHRRVRSSAVVVFVTLSIFSASIAVPGSVQKPDEQTEASLLAAAEAIPDVDVVLKKKTDTQFVRGLGKFKAAKSSQKPVAAAKSSKAGEDQSARNKKTSKDGGFSFENVPPGTYNLTFDAPKVSPAMSGKVEYLVIVQQVVAGSPDNPASQTYDDSKPKTARIPIARIKDGLDFTVGPQPPQNVFQASKPGAKKPAADSKKGEPPPAMMSEPPQKMNLRGKIFLVEIGTIKIVRDLPEGKPPNQ